MITYNVGGLFKGHHCKTLTEALAKAKHDDRIVLHKNVTESVKIEKDIILDGNGHTLTVPDEYIGLSIQGNAAEIQNLVIKTPIRSMAIFSNAKDGIKLSHVTVKIGGPVRKFNNMVVLNDGANTIEHSELKKLFLHEQATLQATDSTFTSYYGPGLALLSRDDYNFFGGRANLTNCKIDHCFFAAHAMIESSTLVTYNVFKSVLLKDCRLQPSDRVVVDLRKEEKTGLIHDKSETIYVAEFTGTATIINLLVSENTTNDAIGFYGADATILIKDVKNAHKINHLFKRCALTFQNVEDTSFYQLDHTTVTAMGTVSVASNQAFKTALSEIDEMIGLQEMKERLHQLFNNIKAGGNAGKFTKHMMFLGDPGTGKTSVARLTAQVLYEIGAVPINGFAEIKASQLVSGYRGQTAGLASETLDQYIGQVIFIDEAYDLIAKDGETDFHAAALTVLLRFLDDHREDTVVILAGYDKEMQELLASNPGLARRLTQIHFADYTPSEMASILKLMLHKNQAQLEQVPSEKLIEMFDKLTRYSLSVPDNRGRRTNGGNGGLVRNIFEDALTNANTRLQGYNPDNRIDFGDIRKAFQKQADVVKARRDRI